MITKHMYESPEVELLEIKVKGIFMSSPDFNDDGNETPIEGGDENF